MFKLEQIGNHIEQVKSWNPSRVAPNQSISYVDLSSVDKDLKVLNHDLVQYISAKEAPSRAKQLIEVNDILVATVRPNLNAVAYVDSSFENGTASTGYCILRPSKSLDFKYLYYWVRGKTFINEMVKKATGASYPAVSDRIIKKSKIPLPPLPVQKRIAQILDLADAYRQKTKALIDKYDELAQSIFLEMFGDPVTNPKGWDKKPMGELMKIVRGGSPRPIKNYVGGNIPWIKIGDATKGDDIYLNQTKEHIIEAGLNKTRLLPKGSLIFANCGVSLGFARIINFEGCIHDGWLAFSDFNEEQIDKVFLLKALNSVTKYFRDSAPDGTQPNLNTGIMKEYEIFLPPIRLQKKYVQAIENLSTQKTNIINNLDKAEDLFSSLLQKAFKGELVNENDLEPIKELNSHV